MPLLAGQLVGFWPRVPTSLVDWTIMIDESGELRAVLTDMERLRGRADDAFAQVASSHPSEMACGSGCNDCCHAVFDLSPIETLAIVRGFLKLDRKVRREAARRGNKARKAFDRVAAEALGASGEDRLAVLSKARIACPLLQDGHCLLYEQRPLTCRLYGIPVAIEGQPRICGLTRFKEGQTYPTVDLGIVLAELEALSRRACELWPELEPVRLDMGRAFDLAERTAADLRALLP